MRVDLNKPLIGLDGKEIPNTNLGQILANAIGNTVFGEAAKTIPIAIALYKGEAIEIDGEDYEFLKKFVTNNQGFSNLLEYRILEHLT